MNKITAVILAFALCAGAAFAQGMAVGGPLGRLRQTIERLTAETPREQALKKIEAKDKDAYAAVMKELAEANAGLLELAKKAGVELPKTEEQRKAGIRALLVEGKEHVDALLETDKTDSTTAIHAFNLLARKHGIELSEFGVFDVLEDAMRLARPRR